MATRTFIARSRPGSGISAERNGSFGGGARHSHRSFRKALHPARSKPAAFRFFPEVALTPREVEVLSLVAQGLGNKEIGDVLGTAPGTVKAHVQSILSKLDAKDRTHAVTIAISRGIIHLESPRTQVNG